MKTLTRKVHLSQALEHKLLLGATLHELGGRPVLHTALFSTASLPCPVMTSLAEIEECKYRFVTFEGVKSVKDAADKRGTRSHVRKAILRSYKTRGIQENLRFYVAPPISPRQKRAHAKKDSKVREHLPNGGFIISRLREYSPSHPFTAHVSRHVPLPAGRIDGLLKSGQSYTAVFLPRQTLTCADAFRIAAEPLFDARHVDSDRGLTQVFPGCLSRPIFLNALMYSVMQAENNDHTPD